MRLRRPISVAALVIASAALLPTAAFAANQTVIIQNFVFTPPSTTVNVGETVTWTNRDQLDHTATANNGTFNKTVQANSSVSFAFAIAGTYAYHCAIHPSMTGTIIVLGGAPTPTPVPPTPTPTQVQTVPPTPQPTVPPSPSPSPSPPASPSSSPSTSPSPSPAPTTTGTPIVVPTSVALASPSTTAAAGSTQGDGPGPVLAAGGVLLAIGLAGMAIYLYRRR